MDENFWPARSRAFVLDLATDGAYVVTFIGTPVADFMTLVYFRLACCTCGAVSWVWIKCTFGGESSLSYAGGF